MNSNRYSASRRPMFRRSFLQQLFATAAFAGAATSSRSSLFGADAFERPYGSETGRNGSRPPDFGKPKLRITKLETMLVKPRWLFLKIHTDEGVLGLGEPITEGRAKTCAAAIAEIEPYLVGKDPRSVVHHWQAIYRH